MSNNRMWLVHEPTGKRILLAKYFPSTNWQTFHPQEKIDEWFKQFELGEDRTWGDTDFVIQYEQSFVEFPFSSVGYKS